MPLLAVLQDPTGSGIRTAIEKVQKLLTALVALQTQDYKNVLDGQALPFLGLPLPFHCLPLTFHVLALPFLGLLLPFTAFHWPSTSCLCLSFSFHCLFTAFP